MTVRFYSSLDAGVPALTGDVYSRVKQILLACLVNGYGSKPAAGWVVGHDVVGGFSLGNGDGFINFMPGTNPSAYIAYIMESITDGTTALATGYNRRSAAWYDGQTSTERQSFYNIGLGTAGYYWSVIADAKTVILLVGGNHSTADPPNYTYSSGHYFGAYINALGLSGPATFCSLGGGASSAAQAILGGDSGYYGMALRNPFTGLVDQGAGARYQAASALYSSGGISTRSKLLPSRLYPVRCGLISFGLGINNSTTSRVVGGYLRGLISEPTIGAALASEVFGLFGVSNTWQSRVKLLAIPGGAQWAPLFNSSAEPGFFVSLAEADWS